MTEEDQARFDQINQAIAEAVASENIEEITKQDVQFHETIYSITNNDRLVHMLHQLKEHIFRYRFEYIKDMKNKSAIVEEHKKISAAIISKNTKTACKEIERHIEVQEKYILNTLIKEKK